MTGAVWRPLLIYCGLLVLFRSTGKRTLNRTTTFDFVLLLIISEAVSSALLADDHSVTGAAIAVFTMISADLLLSLVRRRFPRVDQLLSYDPTVLIQDGIVLDRNLAREGLDRRDILEAARQTHGLTRMNEIRFAVLESNGSVSIIPFPSARLTAFESSASTNA